MARLREPVGKTYGSWTPDEIRSLLTEAADALEAAGGALREAEDLLRAWRNRAPESWSLAARTRRWLADRTGTAQ